ncbi:MAG: hypothetical protein WD851_08600 [Pirellulales bacterium]
MRLATFAAVVVCYWCSPNAQSLQAADYFLTVGGGYGPAGNQVSLERNVIFQQGVLAEKRPDKPVHDVFFSDGDNELPDLQYRDPEFEKTCPRAQRMMAELLGDPNSMDLVYRNHEIADIRGAAAPNAIRRRLRDLSREVKSGDRLIIYATGHGGAADQYQSYEYESDESDPTPWSDDEETSEQEYNHYDTSLYFWDGESITASEFTHWLNRLPKDVTVVLVMVQCYSGGFAHTIFHEADADLGLAAHARCGFFSQVHDRAAAGCTPEVNEADYQEYSSFFWAALAGRTRTGEPITAADYDENGVVSFSEAHAYAVIESDTIDVPVRTSDALLRKYSQSDKKRKKSEGDDEAASSPFGRLFGGLSGAADSDEPQELLEFSGTIDKLVEIARPDQRAILEQLPAKLELKGNPTIEIIQLKLTQVTAKGTAAGAKLAMASSAYANALERVQEDLRGTWPELETANSPLLMALASDRADEFIAHVEGLGTYESLCAARERVEKLSDEQQGLLHQEAKFQRLLRTAENVVLAANLARIAPEEIVDRYEQMVSLEEGALTVPDPTAATAAAVESPTEPVAK